MSPILRYMSANAVELMFALSIVALIYVVVRRMRAHPIVALLFSLSPVFTFWAYKNALAGGVMLGFF